MPEFFTILIKVNIALVLFCLGYYLVLRKLTFYTLNRAYLVTAIIFSSVYPFIDLSVFVQQHQEIVAPVQNVVVIWKAPAAALAKHTAYWNWLEIAFWTGAAVFAARLLFQMVSLYSIHARSTTKQINGQRVRVVNADISPFSFWQSIYINPEKLNAGDLDNIITHEQVHVKEWHTLDVLLTEISVIFYWFNPGIWMIKRAVRENIEFITDRKILQKGLDSKAYQYSLLNIAFNNSAPPITSNFNLSTLKKRIMMMNAKRSSNLNLTRYAFLMPVVIVFLLVFSFSKAAVVKKISLLPVVVESFMEHRQIPEIETSSNKQISSKTLKTDTSVKLDTSYPAIFAITYNGNGKYSLGIGGKSLSAEYFKDLDSVAFAKSEQQRMHLDSIAEKGKPVFGLSMLQIKNQHQLEKLNDLSDEEDKVLIVYDAATALKTKAEVRILEQVDRASLKSFKEQLIFINHQISSQQDLNSLPLNNIKSVWLQTGKAPIEQYGQKAKNGVLYIETKK